MKMWLILGICCLILLVGCDDQMYENPKYLLDCQGSNDCMNCCINASGRAWSAKQRFIDCELRIC